MELHPLVTSPSVLRGSLVRVDTNTTDGGGEYERTKLTGRASLVEHPYPSLGWSPLYMLRALPAGI